jgi:flagellar biosynthesis protein FlhA
MTSQLFGHSRTLISAAMLLVVLAFLGLPKAPLLSVAALLGGGAWVMSRSETESSEPESSPVTTAAKTLRKEPTRPLPSKDQSKSATTEAAKAASTAAMAEAADERPGGKPPTVKATAPEATVTDWLRVDAMELSIGYRLIALADPNRGGDLLDRLGRVRQRVARELGMIAPQVAIRDDLALQPQEYRIAIRGVTVANGTSYPGRLLAIIPPGMTDLPEGREGDDPATGQPAVWIAAEGRQAAELSGCRVKEASAVVMDHLAEVIIHHADELLSRDQVMQLIERVRLGSTSLVDEVVPNLVRVGEIQKVLQNLLRERVSILDMETILEALALAAVATRDPEELTEHARRALSRRLVQPYLGLDGHLNVVMLDKTVENRLSAAVDQSTRPEQGRPPILVVGALVRRLVRDLTHTDLPGLVVLAQQEIPRDTPVDNIATVAPAGFEDEEEDSSDAVKPAEPAFSQKSAIPAPHAWPPHRAGRQSAPIPTPRRVEDKASDISPDAPARPFHAGDA